MKKIFALLITLTMLFVLASCGQESSSKSATAPATPAEENVAELPVGATTFLLMKQGVSEMKNAGYTSEMGYSAPYWDFTGVDFSTPGEYPAQVTVYRMNESSDCFTQSYGFGFTVRIVES